MAFGTIADVEAAVWQRADSKCEKCGRENKSGIDGRRLLEIHHKRSRAHNEPDDLALLCVDCHSNTHREQRRRELGRLPVSRAKIERFQAATYLSREEEDALEAASDEQALCRAEILRRGLRMYLDLPPIERHERYGDAPCE